MAKTSFTILGLSLALLLTAGCGKSFEAIHKPTGAPSGKGGSGGGAGSGGQDLVITDEEKALRTRGLQEMEQSLRNNLTESSKYVDLNDLADEMIKGVSLRRNGGMLEFSAVLKAEANLDAKDVVVLEAKLPIDADGVARDTSGDQIEVLNVAENNEAGAQPTAAFVIDKSQYLVTYICSQGCEKVDIRLQRTTGEVEVDGRKQLTGYAATFAFQLNGQNQGVLVTSTLKAGAAVKNVEDVLRELLGIGEEDADLVIGEDAPVVSEEEARELEERLRNQSSRMTEVLNGNISQRTNEKMQEKWDEFVENQNGQTQRGRVIIEDVED